MIRNTYQKEDVMKRLMEMFEEIMVTAAYAEEGVSTSFLRLNNNLHEDLEDRYETCNN
jgi:hypothetical protein